MGGQQAVSSWPLIGRQAEIASLRGHATDTWRGVALIGPAGVGKTRLAEELVSLVARDGTEARWVAATRSAATLPLGCLAPLLPPSMDRAERALDSLQRAAEEIVNGAGGRRLVLAIDDAHLLDDMSAAVVGLLVDQHAVSVIATIRTGEPLADSVQRLWKDQGLERIDVPPLDRASVDELIEIVLGGPVEGATGQELWDACQGNVLFLRELLLGAKSAGLLQERAGIWGLTSHLRAVPRLVDVVEARLGELAPDTRHTLDLVAVAGEIGLGLLCTLVDPADIDRLEARGLLRVVESGRRRNVTVAHPLYGEVIRAQLSAVRSMAVNRLLAESIEGLGARRREDATNIAVWRLDGGGDVRADLMIDAAHRAFFSHDDVLAERLARIALHAEADRPTAAILLAEILGSTGRNEEAHQVVTDAVIRAERDEDIGLASLHQAHYLYWGLARPDDAREALAAARTRIRDHEWSDTLGAYAASLDQLDGRPDSALEAVAETLTHNGGRAFLMAAQAAVPALAVTGQCDDAIALASRAGEARAALGEVTGLGDPGMLYVSQALALIEAGRLDEANAVCDLGQQVAIGMRSLAGQSWFLLLLGRAALSEGRVATADRRFREAALLFEEQGHRAIMRWCVAGRLIALSWSGEGAVAAAAQADLECLPDRTHRMLEVDILRARAWCAWANQDQVGAVELLHLAIEEGRAGGSRMLEAAAVHDLCRVDGADEKTVARLEHLAASTDGQLTELRWRFVAGVTEKDPEALSAVGVRFADIGAHLFAAESFAVAAGLLRTAGRSRDGTRAASRSAELLERCEGARSPLLTQGGPASRLTRREREVASLAAGGLSTREIADQLVVSTRTVENHLHRAYEKLGVSGKTDLAAALTSLG